MAERQIHPSPQELRSFGLGLLAPSAQEEVERHVAGCDSCCQALRGVADDTLVAQLREVRTATDETIATVRDTPAVDARLPGLPPELADHPRYLVRKMLGAGGMGVVYQAEHRLMDRPVALKVMSRHLIGSGTAVERFRQEVRAAARLSHPNIVAAYDAEQAGDLHLLVMEYVEGVSLARLVENRGPLDVTQACHYARQAATGLKHAFEQGMVHRDIKPHNLMVTRRGQVKILDFGLARLARERDVDVAASTLGVSQADAVAMQDGLTADGAILGTPDYIAPEQIGNARNADIRADIYGLGCTLYFLLAGHPPYPRGSAAEKVNSHLDAKPLPLSASRPDVPPGLAQVVERMMAKDPAARYQTPADVIAALAPWAKPQQPGAALPPLPAGDVFDGRGLSVLEASLPSSPLETTWGGGPPFPRPLLAAAARPQSWRDLVRSPLGKAALAAAMVMIALGCYIAFRDDDRQTVGLTTDAKPPSQKLGDHDVPLPVARHAGTPQDVAAYDGNDADVPSPPMPTPVEGLETDAAPPELAYHRPPRVLFVLPHRNFWYPDYVNSKKFFELGGAEIVVASSDLTSPARPSTQSEGEKEPVAATLLLADAQAADYDAVVFVGASGGGHSEYLDGQPQHAAAVSFIQAMQAADKVVAAICGGPRVLGDAGVLAGVEATGFEITQPFLEDDGAIVVSDKPVVVAGKVITASDWNAAEEFAAAVLSAAR